jgi:hypothetical protein
LEGGDGRFIGHGLLLICWGFHSWGVRWFCWSNWLEIWRLRLRRWRWLFSEVFLVGGWSCCWRQKW